MEICVCHPDADCSVFLEQELAAGDLVAEALSDCPAREKLDDAEEDGRSGKNQDAAEIVFAVEEDEVYGLAQAYEQDSGLEVECRPL